MEKPKRCAIEWCSSTGPLLRRKETSPLYKQFGSATLCATHVPPWRKEEYEPLDAPPPPPAAPPREPRGRGGETPGDAPRERPRGGRGAKEAGEGPKAPPGPPQEPEAPPQGRGGETPPGEGGRDRTQERRARDVERTSGPGRGEGGPHPPIPRTRGKAKAEGAPF